MSLDICLTTIFSEIFFQNVCEEVWGRRRDVQTEFLPLSSAWNIRTLVGGQEVSALLHMQAEMQLFPLCFLK